MLKLNRLIRLNINKIDNLISNAMFNSSELWGKLYLGDLWIAYCGTKASRKGSLNKQSNVHGLIIEILWSSEKKKKDYEKIDFCTNKYIIWYLRKKIYENQLSERLIYKHYLLHLSS